MQLVSTVTVGAGGAATISLTGIPQDATDLLLLVSSRLSSAGFSVGVQFNGSSATNYSYRTLYGTGSSVASQSFATQAEILAGISSGGTDTANTFGNMSFYIPNYTSSNAKTLSADSVSENNATQAYQQIAAGLWSLTNAITSITLDAESTRTFLEGSSVSLYKITKA